MKEYQFDMKEYQFDMKAYQFDIEKGGVCWYTNKFK